MTLSRIDQHEANQVFRRLADASPAMIWMADPAGRRTYFNKAWLEFTGRSLEAELGEGWLENVFPEDRPSYLALYEESLAARKPFKAEYRLRHADGTYRWVLVQGVPLFSEEGNFEGYMGTLLDVHDRKQ